MKKMEQTNRGSMCVAGGSSGNGEGKKTPRNRLQTQKTNQVMCLKLKAKPPSHLIDLNLHDALSEGCHPFLAAGGAGSFVHSRRPRRTSRARNGDGRWREMNFKTMAYMEHIRWDGSGHVQSKIGKASGRYRSGGQRVGKPAHHQSTTTPRETLAHKRQQKNTWKTREKERRAH